MEKFESLVSCCGNVKRCNCYGKQDGGFSKKLNTRLCQHHRCHLQPPCTTVANRTVFNIHWQCESLGRASSELYADKVPETAENSSILSTEDKGFGHQGPCCPSIIPGFMYLGGDFISCRGTGSKSTTRRNFSKSGITRSCGNSICCCLVFVSLS